MSQDSCFVTLRGHAQLEARLKEIREVDRPQNIRDIEEARAHGDLSENAEFHAAKERQGFLDLEMRTVEDMIARARPIDVAALTGDRVVFGATVTLVNVDTDEEVTYQIVGVDEADLGEGLISYESPLARALIGKEEGDEVDFRAPAGKRTYEILGVSFGS